MDVDAIPVDSIPLGVVVIPTISRRKPSNSNSTRVGKYGLVSGTKGRSGELTSGLPTRSTKKTTAGVLCAIFGPSQSATIDRQGWRQT
jgi:hypothetical protein